MACLAIFTAVAFFLEYHQNNKLNEAQFVIDLNNQFLNEGKMASVEHDLEKYFNAASLSPSSTHSRSSASPPSYPSSTDDGKLAGKEAGKEEAHETDKEAIAKELRNKYAMENKKHQDLVNYLVHLEGVAALVNNGVLRISAINDLMAYRFFIAVNNPLVQELELKPFKEYYKGIYKLYPEWAKKLKSVPLGENELVPTKR